MQQVASQGYTCSPSLSFAQGVQRLIEKVEARTHTPMAQLAHSKKWWVLCVKCGEQMEVSEDWNGDVRVSGDLLSKVCRTQQR